MHPFEVFINVWARHFDRLELGVQFLVRVVVFLLLHCHFNVQRQAIVRSGRVRWEEQIVERLDVARVVAVADSVVRGPRLVEGRIVLQTIEVPQPASIWRDIAARGLNTDDGSDSRGGWMPKIAVAWKRRY